MVQYRKHSKYLRQEGTIKRIKIFQQIRTIEAANQSLGLQEKNSQYCTVTTRIPLELCQITSSSHAPTTGHQEAEATSLDGGCREPTHPTTTPASDNCKKRIKGWPLPHFHLLIFTQMQLIGENILLPESQTQWSVKFSVFSTTMLPWNLRNQSRVYGQVFSPSPHQLPF